MIQGQQFKTNAATSSDDLNPVNNPLSPKFTGTKTPISGKPGQYTVLNKGQKPFKPDTRTAGQKRNADLDSSIAQMDKDSHSVAHGNQGNMNGGWIARGQHALKQKTNIYDNIMNKVGEKSPRYNQTLAAKERTVAGMSRQFDHDSGYGKIDGTPSAPQGYTPPRNGKPAMFGPNTMKPSRPGRRGDSPVSRSFYDNESRDRRANTYLTSPENKAYYANKKKK